MVERPSGMLFGDLIFYHSIQTRMAHTLYKNFAAITIFSIAMALMESAVVVYLRELYYPGGFTVAFMDMPRDIITVELLRELATLVMLLAVGWLAGQTMHARFAWFLYSFAVWDIFYYAWLKVFINWPLSLFDWDILFLLPVTWLAPVLAPVICSVTMIVLSVLILLGEDQHLKFRMTKTAWTLIIAGALVIYASFTRDYTGIIIQHGFYKNPGQLLQNPSFLEMARTFIPESFSWSWFLAGELLILAGIVQGLNLVNRKKEQEQRPVAVD